MKAGWLVVGFGGQRVGSMQQDWMLLGHLIGGLHLAAVLRGLCLGCSLGPPRNPHRLFLHAFTALFSPL